MNIREDDISFAFGSFETGGKLERLYPRFLSKETGDQGWALLNSQARKLFATAYRRCMELYAKNKE